VSEATIRARIKAVLDTVSNAGLIYNYERFDKGNFTVAIDLFRTTIGGAEVFRGWTVTCSSMSPVALTRMGASGSDTEIHYIFKVRGYFGLHDASASEITAIAIVEAVVLALNADATLRAYFGGGAKSLAELTTFEPRRFAGWLCHYAEITMPIPERDQS
jgi:hypothetical protein